MSLCINISGNKISNDIFLPYKHSHPKTIENFSGMENGSYWFSRLLTLENFSGNNSEQITSPVEFQSIGQNLSSKDFDIIYAGGGLAVLHAAVMSSVYGYRVCIFDKFDVGTTHRDWNISLAEIQKAIDVGLISETELSFIIAHQYSEGGFIKFFNDSIDVKTKPLYMKGVLDVAIDANTLLSLARKKIEDAGGTILNNTHFKKVTTFTDSVSVTIESNGTLRSLNARIFIDSMGAFSPISRYLNPTRQHTHCCPTVGTISSGFINGTEENTVNPNIGEILVTLDDADQQGRQLIWEGFPGKDNNFITYLFFYDTINSERDKSLLNLYEVFFSQLNGYKKQSSSFSIGRPLFGIIPSYLHQSVSRQKKIATHNILCIGDSAGMSSPLTYCGFGSFIRNLPRTTSKLHEALESKRTNEKQLSLISSYEANVSIVANFGQFLVGNKHLPKNAVNETMNIILNVLHHLPEHIGKELFQDTLTWDSYNTLMSTVPKMYPTAYKLLLRHHGIKGLFWWLINFAGFTIDRYKEIVR